MSHKKSAKNVTADTDLAAWCAALVPNEVDKVPDGWFSAADLADRLKKSRDTISGQISTAVREGRAEMQKFRVMTTRGAYPVPHYRLK